MPQACAMDTPNCVSYACCSVRGAAEPPTAIVRSEDRSQPSCSQSSFTAIQTVGTAPVNVTFSRWTISQMSRGCGFGPAKIWLAPTITDVNGTHQEFAWNIGVGLREPELVGHGLGEAVQEHRAVRVDHALRVARRARRVAHARGVGLVERGPGGERRGGRGGGPREPGPPRGPGARG